MTISFVHFEIPADDVERASEFYRKAFGWAVDKMPGADYAVVHTDTDSADPSDSENPPDGGIGSRKGPSRLPHLTIIVDDIDTVAAQVQRHGGKIVQKKHAMGEMGFSATFTDPEGNTIGLFQPAPG